MISSVQVHVISEMVLSKVFNFTVKQEGSTPMADTRTLRHTDSAHATHRYQLTTTEMICLELSIFRISQNIYANHSTKNEASWFWSLCKHTIHIYIAFPKNKMNRKESKRKNPESDGKTHCSPSSAL